VGDMPRPKMLSSSASIAPKGCAAVGGSAVGPPLFQPEKAR
jgi:hypothetical protein